MAIISFTHQFVFIKTRKTAGTSIQDALLPVCKGNDLVTRVWQNLVTSEKAPIKEFASIDEINSVFNTWNYFKFGFTRNPYELTLSRFLYEVKTKKLAAPLNPKAFNTWVRKIYFVRQPRFPNGRYIKDRSRYLLFDEQLNPVVDFIGRFENLEGDFNKVIKRIGLNDIKIPHSNRANANNLRYREWINTESKKLIASHFDFELDYFNYEF